MHTGLFFLDCDTRDVEYWAEYIRVDLLFSPTRYGTIKL